MRPACHRGATEPALLWRIFALFLLAAFASNLASALNPSRQISQYAHTAWHTEDGLFSGTPSVIAQTTDGYLWIGTNIGLERFDGVRFVQWNPPAGKRLLDPRILSLLGTRDGSLWIGTGYSVSRLKNGELVNYPQVSGRVLSLLEDDEGAVWLVRTEMTDTMGPLCRIKDVHLRCYGTRDGFPIELTTRLARTDSSELWVAGYSQLCRWKPGSSKLYFDEISRHPNEFASVRAIASGSDGAVWVALKRSSPPVQLQRIDHGIPTTHNFPAIHLSNSEVISLFVDRSNALWIGTSNHGIFRIRGDRVDHFGSADGLSSDAVGEFFQDAEGSVWVVTAAGIDNFRDVRVASYSMREGLSATGASSVVAASDGAIWIGNYRALDVLRDGRLSAIRTGYGLPGSNVTTLFEDHAGRLWVGLDTGLWVYEGGVFRAIRHADGTSLGTIFSITEDDRHDLWVRAGHNLDRIENQVLQEEITSSQIATSFIIAANPVGGIVLGLVSGDLVYYRNGKTITIPSRVSGNTQQIRDLLVDPDGSVWGTTMDELVRWKDGRRQNFTTRNGLPCDEVFALVKDASGSIWLYTRCGLIGIAQSELSRWWNHPDTTVAVTRLDEFDGVRPGLTSLKAQAVRTPDGRLWFVNGAILQMFDPTHFDRNQVPPPVQVEEVVADRRSYLPRPGLRLPPLTRDLEINYTAPSFVAPQKVVFRYKLEGHDPGWQEPGTRRQAFYSDLLPGNYRFRVLARNNDGVWNEDGAALDFVIEPAYYQTAWFKALVTITALGAIWVLYLLRMRQVTGQLQARLGERLVERERIARELHDTLLQGFQGLVLRFQAVMKQLPPDDPAYSMMEKALDRADEVLLEGRQRVRDLRSETSTVNELGEKLASYGTELAEDWKVAFSLEIVGAPKPLDPIVCD